MNTATNPATAERVAPCPFCGSPADVQNDYGRVFWVQCTNLECGSTNGKEYENPAEGVAEWNRRATQASAEPVAPWLDFLGQTIHHGQRLSHPDGIEFTAVRLHGYAEESDAWRAVYDAGDVSRLCLQIGAKGQAFIVSAAPSSAPSTEPACQCDACKAVVHDSDCAVHNMPAVANLPCDCGKVARTPSTEPAAVSEKVMRALTEACNVAMRNSVAARIPECGYFGEIAQDLSWAIGELAAPERAPSIDSAGEAQAIAAARYEFVRCLHPHEFANLWRENVAGRGTFDDLVDAAMQPQGTGGDHE